MTDNKEIYSLGRCDICGKEGALKYGLCLDCAKPKVDYDMPDMFKSIFGNTFNSNIKNKG